MKTQTRVWQTFSEQEVLSALANLSGSGNKFAKQARLTTKSGGRLNEVVVECDFK